MILLSITGVVKIAVVIVVILIVWRIMSQFIKAGKEAEDEKEMLREDERHAKERADHARNFGSTSISKEDDPAKRGDFTDFEEIKS